MFWSDKYCGIPFKEKGLTREGIDCWGLLRMVWKDNNVCELDTFTNAGSRLLEIQGIAKHFDEIPIGNEAAFDCAVMKTGVQVRGEWRMEETHVGIVAMQGLVLHIEDKRLSHVTEFKGLNVSRILRPKK